MVVFFQKILSENICFHYKKLLCDSFCYFVGNHKIVFKKPLRLVKNKWNVKLKNCLDNKTNCCISALVHYCILLHLYCPGNKFYVNYNRNIVVSIFYIFIYVSFFCFIIQVRGKQTEIFCDYCRYRMWESESVLFWLFFCRFSSLSHHILTCESGKEREREREK